MVQLEGFQSSNPNLVFKINKALYGFKQALGAQFDKLSSKLLQLNFHGTKCDSSLFFGGTLTSTIYVLVYVDDILITGSDSKQISDLIASLHNLFALKNLGNLHYFIGIETVSIADGVMHLDQTKYIKDLLRKVHFENAKLMPTSMVSCQKLFAVRSIPCKNISQYQSLVGDCSMQL